MGSRRTRRPATWKVVESNVAREKYGQIFAFILAILFGAAGTFLIHQGHDLAGSVVTGADLVSIVTIFILGRKYRREDVQAKSGAPLLDPPARRD